MGHTKPHPHPNKHFTPKSTLSTHTHQCSLSEDQLKSTGIYTLTAHCFWCDLGQNLHPHPSLPAVRPEVRLHFGVAHAHPSHQTAIHSCICAISNSHSHSTTQHTPTHTNTHQHTHSTHTPAQPCLPSGEAASGTTTMTLTSATSQMWQQPHQHQPQEAEVGAHQLKSLMIHHHPHLHHKQAANRQLRQ